MSGSHNCSDHAMSYFVQYLCNICTIFLKYLYIICEIFVRHLGNINICAIFVQFLYKTIQYLISCFYNSLSHLRYDISQLILPFTTAMSYFILTNILPYIHISFHILQYLNSIALFKGDLFGRDNCCHHTSSYSSSYLNLSTTYYVQYA